MNFQHNVEVLWLCSWLIGRIDTVLESVHDQHSSDCRLVEMLDTGQTDQRMMRTDDTDTGEAAAAGDTGEDMSGTEAVPPRT